MGRDRWIQGSASIRCTSTRTPRTTARSTSRTVERKARQPLGVRDQENTESTFDRILVHIRIVLCSFQGVIRIIVNAIEILAPLPNDELDVTVEQAKDITKLAHKNRRRGDKYRLFLPPVRVFLESIAGDQFDASVLRM